MFYMCRNRKVFIIPFPRHIYTSLLDGTQPFEPVKTDFKALLPNPRNEFLLKITEFSCFPFAHTGLDTYTLTVNKCLLV